MNDLTINDTVTMTSLELVDFINYERKAGESELQHKHFLEKVPKVLGAETSAKFSADLPDSYGRPRKGFKFPKREACLMAMSYSYELQAKVFDKMTELEAKVKNPIIHLTRVDLLKLALESEEQRLQLESKVQELAPKAAILDQISARTDTMTFTQTAKVLGQKREQMTARMHAEGYIYRQNGSWVAYEQHIKNGNLVYKEANYTDEKTGLTCRKPYCHVTPKGLVALAKLFAVTIEEPAHKVEVQKHPANDGLMSLSVVR